MSQKNNRIPEERERKIYKEGKEGKSERAQKERIENKSKLTT